MNNYRLHVKQSFNLAYPVMLSQLGHVLMGLTDNVMVGHVGANSLAAASLGNVMFNVLLLFGVGVSYGITPLVATAHGRNDTVGISQALRHGLVVNASNGVILFLIVMVSRPLLFYIGQPEEVVRLSSPYLGIIAFSLLPTLVFQTFRQFTEGLSHTRVAMTVMIVSNVVHIPLNYIFIYGHLGLPAMGLNGAGWATLISRVFMATSIAAYVYYSHRFRIFRSGFGFGNYMASHFRAMLYIGIPAGVQFIFEVVAFDFSAVMMGWLGTKTLAAHQIAINLATMSYMMTSGLAAAATIQVSRESGKGDYAMLRTSANTLLLMALAFMTVWGLVFVFGRHVLPSLYIDDPEVRLIAAQLIVIAGLFQISDGVQVVCAGALRGLRDVRIPSLFIFIAYWIIGLPLGYTLGFKAHLGATGIWSGLLIGLTLTALAMYFRFRRLSGKLPNSNSLAVST